MVLLEGAVVGFVLEVDLHELDVAAGGEVAS